LEAFGELLGGDFDGNDPIETGVTRLVDFAHAAGAAGADGSDDLVRSQASSGGQRHRSSGFYRTWKGPMNEGSCGRRRWSWGTQTTFQLRPILLAACDIIGDAGPPPENIMFSPPS